MNDAGAKRFRSQLNGYNRDDVNHYIKETDLGHAEELEKAQAKAAAAEEELAGIRDGMDALLADKAALEEAAEEKDARIRELEEKLRDFEAERENSAQELKEKTEELDALNRNAASLAESVAHLRDEQKKAAEAAEAKDAEIARLNGLIDENSRTAKERSTRIAELEAEEEGLKADLAAAEASSEKNAQELYLLNDRHNGVVSELRSKLADKEKEAADLKTYVYAQIEELKASKAKEIAAVRAAVDTEVAEKVSAARGSIDDKGSDAYKLDMYDKISGQLGDILINANRSADQILSEARSEAERIRSDTDLECEQKRAECDAIVARTRSETEAEASYIRERISQTATELLDTVSADLHGSVETCIKELNTSITDMEYEIKTLLSKIGARTDEMNGLISYYQNSVLDGIREKLAAMDEKYGIRPKDKRDE